MHGLPRHGPVDGTPAGVAPPPRGDLDRWSPRNANPFPAGESNGNGGSSSPRGASSSIGRRGPVPPQTCGDARHPPPHAIEDVDDALSTWDVGQLNLLRSAVRSTTTGPWRSVRYHWKRVQNCATGKDIVEWIAASVFFRGTQGVGKPQGRSKRAEEAGGVASDGPPMAWAVAGAMLRRDMFFQLNRRETSVGFRGTSGQLYVRDDPHDLLLSGRVDRPVWQQLAKPSKFEQRLQLLRSTPPRTHVKVEGNLCYVLLPEVQLFDAENGRFVGAGGPDAEHEPASPGSLHEPPAASSSEMLSFAQVRDAIRPPSVTGEDPERCEWVLGWEVTVIPGKTDTNGWEYGSVFTDLMEAALAPHLPHSSRRTETSNCTALPTAKTMYRLRLWKRPARAIPSSRPNDTHCSGTPQLCGIGALGPRSGLPPPSHSPSEKVPVGRRRRSSCDAEEDGERSRGVALTASIQSLSTKSLTSFTKMAHSFQAHCFADGGVARTPQALDEEILAGGKMLARTARQASRRRSRAGHLTIFITHGQLHVESPYPTFVRLDLGEGNVHDSPLCPAQPPSAATRPSPVWQRRATGSTASGGAPTTTYEWLFLCSAALRTDLEAIRFSVHRADAMGLGLCIAHADFFIEKDETEGKESLLMQPSAPARGGRTPKVKQHPKSPHATSYGYRTPELQRSVAAPFTEVSPGSTTSPIPGGDHFLSLSTASVRSPLPGAGHLTPLQLSARGSDRRAHDNPMGRKCGADARCNEETHLNGSCVVGSYVANDSFAFEYGTAGTVQFMWQLSDVMMSAGDSSATSDCPSCEIDEVGYSLSNDVALAPGHVPHVDGGGEWTEARNRSASSHSCAASDTNSTGANVADDDIGQHTDGRFVRRSWVLGELDGTADGYGGPARHVDCYTSARGGGEYTGTGASSSASSKGLSCGLPSVGTSTTGSTTTKERLSAFLLSHPLRFVLLRVTVVGAHLNYAVTDPLRTSASDPPRPVLSFPVTHDVLTAVPPSGSRWLSPLKRLMSGSDARVEASELLLLKLVYRSDFGEHVRFSPAFSFSVTPPLDQGRDDGRGTCVNLTVDVEWVISISTVPAHSVQLSLLRRRHSGGASRPENGGAPNNTGDAHATKRVHATSKARALDQRDVELSEADMEHCGTLSLAFVRELSEASFGAVHMRRLPLLLHPAHGDSSRNSRRQGASAKVGHDPNASMLSLQYQWVLP